MSEPELFDTSLIIESSFAHYIIFAMSIFSVGWGVYNASTVSPPPQAPRLAAPRPC
jgi:hypothetical protein